MAITKKKTQAEIENEQLKAKIDAMEQMLQTLMGQKSTVVAAPAVEEVDDYVEIPPQKAIKVMSLTNNVLVLSTEGYGKGKIYQFNTFGQVRDIPYSDLADILHYHDKFAQEGAFYVMNKDVVYNHGIQEYYETLLDRKKLENILNENKTDIVNLFQSTSDMQREAIVSLLLGKLKNGEELDLNKVNAISKIYGKNIAEMIEQQE
jgi:hypothetical protein